jgi:hypothetical protein
MRPRGSFIFCPLLAGACALMYVAVIAAAPANDPVAVVTGPAAPELDRFAASELCAYLEKLFGVRVQPTTSIPPTARDVFLIGNPTTNPHLKDQSFPEVSDQGIVLRSARSGQRSTLTVGGGSPTATMWAVYELVERWGVRYLLHEDVLPARAEFKMPAFDLKQEPILRVRQWRVINEHAMGPVSWGIADYRPVLDQLAKLKFNRLLCYIWPEQPFLPLEYKGIKHAGGTLFFGAHYPITDDMIGRSLFGTEKEFWNPDLPPPDASDQTNEAAVKHVQNLMDYARQRGMACVVPATLTEFPIEFKPLIEHTRPGHMEGKHTFGLGPDADVDDPVLAGLARTVVETTLKTYPRLDYLELGVAEQREWARQYQRAWTSLDARHGIGKVCSLDAVLAAAQKRKDYPGGAERAVSEVKADILALYFFDQIIADSGIQQLVQSTHTKFVVSVAEELYPVLGRIFLAGCETLNFVDYTPARIVKRREVLKGVPAREIPSVLIYTLHDDNVGVLPQLATHSLDELTKDIRALGWAGFSTRYWLTGDHDPCLAYLSRAAWDTNATPEATYRDQITRVCGGAAVPDMLQLFSEVEAATVTLEWHGLGFAFTVPHMMLQHWKPRPLSPELKSVTVSYQAALEAARRVLRKTQPSGKGYITYWIGRLEFGVAYMQMIEAVRAAATAEAAKDNSRALSEATRALELIKVGLTAYAGVVRDRSDKGAIAVMNEYVARPLQAKVAGLKQPGAVTAAPAVHAVDFQSRKVYQSKQRPSYTSWVSFFPGEHGHWYLTCEEVTRPDHPLPRSSPEKLYEMGLPRGYDKSQHQMEVVMLESNDGLETWQEISRQPGRYQHSAGSFGQARTRDGRFLRFAWSCYSLDPSVAPNEVLYESDDNGRTWKKMPPFHDAHFVSWPHRLRTLRDGTLVLCVPMRPKWGKGSDYPTRTARRLDVTADMQMSLFISHDQGRTWSGSLPILPGQNVSETDFVELPDGNLLFINNSIFANAGRQFVYRERNRFTPGPLERAHSGTVPETVCLAEDGVLVGCMRAGSYYWSDDLGQNWQPLDGARGNGEVYQPWIQYLGDGKVACAGHRGLDDPIGQRDQYVALQTFRLQVLRKTASTKLWIERDYDQGTRSFPNSYTLSLTADGTPLANKDIQVWHVFRDAPGYDSWNKTPLAERMRLGGKSTTVRTGPDGKARLELPEYNGITNIHSSYQVVVRFNSDGEYPDYKPAQLPQLEFYANNGLDP